MELFVYFLASMAIMMLMVLGVYFLIWIAYRRMMPKALPDAPAWLTKPGFWMFSAALLLLTMAFGQIVRAKMGAAK